MRAPFMTLPSLAASGSFYQSGSIPLVRARTLSLTVRGTFHGSATLGATCYIYYSPNGSKWDTIPYTSFDLTLTAGAAVQRTLPIDTPEHGFASVKIVNNDTVRAITDISAWYTIQAWPPEPAQEHGSIEKNTGED